MILPNYWLKRPKLEFDKEARVAFDALIKSVLATDECSFIDFSLSFPKWQFLCYVSDYYDVVLHGSNDLKIEAFEPRQADDVNAFGNQRAVYAASDGLWAMFFAIVDRQNFVMSVNNACIRIEDQYGTLFEPRYVFSISQTALVQKPWCEGSVYFLPKRTFSQQAPLRMDDSLVHVAQFASLEPVRPIAKLDIKPEDFPFLEDIRGMDESRSQEYSAAMHAGAPWPEESEVG